MHLRDRRRDPGRHRSLKVHASRRGRCAALILAVAFALVLSTPMMAAAQGRLWAQAGEETPSGVASPTGTPSRSGAEGDLEVPAAPAHGLTSDRGVGQAGTPLARKVVIVVLSGLTWDDLELPQARTLRGIMESGWMANINVATLGKDRTVARALVSLGSGSRADAGPITALGYGAKDKVEEGLASDAYVRHSGRLPLESAVLHLGVAELAHANVGTPYPVRPGLMGSLVQALGFRTAIIGNADESLKAEPDSVHREAVALAMDELGRVDHGAVGKSNVMPDREMAFGLRSNVPFLLYGYRSLPEQVGLVVIDMGDMLRASRYGAKAAPSARRFLRGRALSRASGFVDRLTKLVSDEAAIVIVSPTAADGGPESLTPTPFSLIVPRALSGYATSASTKRPGWVSGSDLVRTVGTVLIGSDRAAAEVPGRPVVRAGGPTQPSIPWLAAAARRVVASAEGRVAVLWMMLVAEILGVAVAVSLLSAKRWDEGAFRLTEALLLGVVTLPLGGVLVGWLWQMLGSRPVAEGLVTPVGFGVLVAAFAAAVASALSLTRLRPSRQLLGVLGVTAIALAADQLMGSPAAFQGLFSYSLVDGSRYYGIGNEGWAVLFTCIVIACALVLEGDHGRWRSWGWAAAAVLLGVAFVVGSPILGANIGGFVAVGAGAATAWLGWLGKRPRAGWVLLAVGAVALGITLMVGLDLVRPAATGTHFSTAVREVTEGGSAGLAAIVSRKLALNLAIFVRVPATLLLFVALGLWIVVRRRPSGQLAGFLSDRPRLATALTALTVAGLVGMVTNDTGVSIPVVMLGIALPAVAMLMLADARWRREALEL